MRPPLPMARYTSSNTGPKPSRKRTPTAEPPPTRKNKDKANDDKDAATPAIDPSWSSSVYFEPGTKYIWDLALDKAGNLYVATGDHGEIYRVTPKGEHSVFFKSDETHIRVLAFDAQENLIAGSDGSGLIYRISPAGEGFVLYSAPKKEITALALDRAGNIYAAAVGEKRSGGGPGGAALAAALLNLGANPPTAARPRKLQASRSRPPLARRRWPVRFHSRAVGPAAAPMCTALRRMVPPQGSGRPTKTSSMPWPLIPRDACWPARAIAATFLPSPAWMIFPIC